MQQLIAERLINAGNLKDAITHYRAALQLDPRLPGMHFELAEALLEATPMDPKAQAEAERELQAAIAASGDDAGIESELGEIEMNRSNHEGARAHYSQALAIDPSSIPALMGLARLEVEANLPEKAVAHLQQILALDPFNAQAHYRLALTYRNLHQNDQSREQMKLFQSIRRTKDQVAALYREMGKPQAAGETEP